MRRPGLSSTRKTLPSRSTKTTIGTGPGTRVCTLDPPISTAVPSGTERMPDKRWRKPVTKAVHCSVPHITIRTIVAKAICVAWLWEGFGPAEQHAERWTDKQEGGHMTPLFSLSCGYSYFLSFLPRHVKSDSTSMPGKFVAALINVSEPSDTTSKC